MKTRRLGMILGILAVSVLIMGATNGPDPKEYKGEEVKITGVLSCSMCKLTTGKHSPDCCPKCLAEGNPPMLTDSSGKQYLLITNEKQTPLMTPERLKLAGGWVTVKGLLVKAKGLQAIFTSSVEEAPQGRLPAPSLGQGKEISLEGDMSCSFCALSHPDYNCKKGCCSHCVAAGDPPLLTDGAGNMYVLMSKEMHQPFATPERQAMVGFRVKVKGVALKGNGIQAILVENIEPIGLATHQHQ